MGKITHADIGTQLTKTEWEANTTHLDSQGNTLEVSRSATLVVAASDASAKSKAGADYVCDGVDDDQVEIQAAIDAINASGVRGILKLIGTFICSAQIDAKSNVDVFGPAEIQINTTIPQCGLRFNGISNAIWKDIVIRRQGAVTSNGAEGNSAIFITGVTDATCVLENVRGINEITQGGTAYGGAGIEVHSYPDSPSPTLIDCEGQGANVSAECFGISVTVKAAPIIYGGKGTGGSNVGGKCYGISLFSWTLAKLFNVVGNGGDLGDANYGIALDSTGVEYSSAEVIATGRNQGPILTGCLGIGGAGGSHGIIAYGPATGVLESCIGKGGTGNSIGIYTSGSATPKLVACSGIGGRGINYNYGMCFSEVSAPIVEGGLAEGGLGSGSNALRIDSGAAPHINGLKGSPQISGQQWSYDSANNGQFRPFATAGYQLITLSVYVKVANAGVLLDIGTSIGGNDIVDNVDIGSTGWKFFAFTRGELAEAAYLYATTSAAIANGDVTIHYAVAINTTDSQGLYIDTQGFATIENSSFLSGGAAATLLIDTNAITAKKWRIKNSTFETLSPSTQYAVLPSASLASAPLEDCHFVGILHANLTSFSLKNSGTATVASGATTVVVNHGLATTPTRVLLTARLWSSASKAWVTNLTTTQFTINVDVDPGAGTAIFDWRAQVGEG